MNACVCVLVCGGFIFIFYFNFAISQHSKLKVETINNADTNWFFLFHLSNDEKKKYFHLDLQCKNRLHLYFCFAYAFVLFHFFFHHLLFCLCFFVAVVSIDSFVGVVGFMHFQIGLVSMVTKKNPLSTPQNSLVYFIYIIRCMCMLFFSLTNFKSEK